MYTNDCNGRNWAFIVLSTGLLYYSLSGHGGGKQGVKALHNADVLALHGMPRMSVLHPSDTVQGSHCVTGTAFDLLSFAAILPRRHPAAPLKSTLLYSPLLGRLYDYEFVRRRAASDFNTQWRGSRNLLLQRCKDLAAVSPHGEVGACPIWVAEGFDEIVLHLPWCPALKGVFERRPGGRGWNPTEHINWAVDGSSFVYSTLTGRWDAGCSCRRSGNTDAMILATPDVQVAYARIREITGKGVEDFDETACLIELENEHEAILKRCGLDNDDDFGLHDGRNIVEILEEDKDVPKRCGLDNDDDFGLDDGRDIVEILEEDNDV
ncbi:hypothetical protein C8R45DRAFT_938373 [Mycena sanguinolenta]|nr:hypothetical protein C8R45DRAFT_938373 [Mycena sanguinolenta]